MEAAHKSNLIFEAVSENRALKVKLLSDIDKNNPNKAWYFTNTSSVPINLIESEAGLDGRILGFHFYNPPAVQRLVELITTEKTLEEATAFANEYAKKLKASGREFFSKNEKKMLKEHVISLLTLRIPATPNIYDLLWSYEDASLWFFTNLKKPCEELETLFLTSFNLKLIRLFPYTMTEFFGDLTADEYETFINLAPTTLME